MSIVLKNNASSFIVADITSSQTGITLESGASFPTLGAGEYFYGTLEGISGNVEIVKVTARSGNALTVVRGQDGSIPSGFAAGSRFEARINAASVEEKAQQIAEAEVQELRDDLSADDGSSLVGFKQTGSSAVARTTEGKLQDFVSVKDLGAVGDGVADDTAAIQNAVNQNRAVFLPTGRYRITSTIDIPRDTTIKGAGFGASVILVDSDITGLRVNRVTVLENLRILGAFSNSTENALIDYGSTGQDTAHTRFYNCWIGGTATEFGDPAFAAWGGYGVKGGNSFSGSFIGCFFLANRIGYVNTKATSNVGPFRANNALVFAGCGFLANSISGVQMVTPQGVVFTGCSFENSGAQGIVVTNSRGANVDSCYFEGNGRSSSEVSDVLANQDADGATSFTIKNCFFIRSEAIDGIIINNVPNVECSGHFFNNYSATGRVAIRTTGGSGSVQNCFVSGPNAVNPYDIAGSYRSINLFSTQLGVVQGFREPNQAIFASGITENTVFLVTVDANIFANALISHTNIVDNTTGFNVFLEVPNPAGQTGRTFTVIKRSANTTQTINVLSSSGFTILGASGNLTSDPIGTKLTAISDGSAWIFSKY